MNSIFEEINEIKEGRADKLDNVLTNAPHTAEIVTADNWPHTYSRQKAVYPLNWVRDNKYWVPVGRVDNAWGDRNLICNCGSPEEYELIK
jgi:glycine dehydrogenase